MTIEVYKLGGCIGRSIRHASLVTEVDVEPEEIPFDLTRFARRHGGDFAQIVHDSPLAQELQPA
jgi:hypothetical protein